MIIIGLHGKARTGKDTAAQYLCDDFYLEPLAFAAPIKSAIMEMFNLDARHIDGELKEEPLPGLGKSPRDLFQSLGTEWGRRLVHPDVWVYTMARWVEMLQEEYRRQGARLPGMVFSDVRFENEAEYIRRLGGLVIHIERDNAEEVAAHESENGIGFVEGDIKITNNDTLDAFYAKLQDIALAKLMES